MEDIHIYLAGGMSGLSFDEQYQWRMRIINAIKYSDFEYSKSPIFFNPPDYYPTDEVRQKSEREVMEHELSHLRKSDLIIVNFNVPQSIGTAMELMCAKENKIPIVGLNKDKAELHPWLIECCSRICDNMRELVNYVVNFYLK